MLNASEYDATGWKSARLQLSVVLSFRRWQKAISRVTIYRICKFQKKKKKKNPHESTRTPLFAVHAFIHIRIYVYTRLDYVPIRFIKVAKSHKCWCVI